MIPVHEAGQEAPLVLELVYWRCVWNNQSTVSVEGTVKNIAGNYTPAKVKAQVVVTDKDGRELGRGDKVGDVAPLAPEAEAHFEREIVLDKSGNVSSDPDSCSIDFMDGDGEHLRWRENPTVRTP